MEFSGKTAFVTGAAGGMGYQIASDLVNAGANVIMVDVKPEPAELPSGTGEQIYLQADLSNEASVADAVGAGVARFGPIHLLANVAGVLLFGEDKSALEIDLDLWDKVMAINLKSMVHTVRHIAPHMRSVDGGAMVHFSTIQCLRGDDAPQDAYQASKAGVIALSKSLAIQLASDNIRSNVICPGGTISPMQERWEDNLDALASIADFVPLGRPGDVRDMANACLFLLSDKASYITGTELIVDGGVLAKP
ncbi:MAG: SDR family NAD(P)-dependent oxidoreductase [Hyphomicrobiales bacterium]